MTTQPHHRNERVEPHTDSPDFTEVIDAYEVLLSITNGDRVAAAILAAGSVVADVLERRPS
jgi:hypothetical protein